MGECDRSHVTLEKPGLSSVPPDRKRNAKRNGLRQRELYTYTCSTNTPFNAHYLDAN